MERVVLIGPGGAGKSTLARTMAEVTGLPLIHLDREYWRAGWVPTPDEEWVATVQRLVQGDRWIMDGNYGGTMPIRFARAHTIVFMDFPRWRYLPRALKRGLLNRGRTRPDMAPGCNERLDCAFTRWLWNYPKEARARTLAALAAAPSGTRIVTLRTPREVAAFAASLSPALTDAVAR